MDLFNLAGKFALITGSGGLLGYEHAYALLEKNAGVILTDLDSESLLGCEEKLRIDFPESQIISFRMDVSDEKSILSLCEKLNQKRIFVEILVNNASIDPKVDKGNSLLETSRLENIAIDQWNKEIAVGLTGAMLCSRVFGSQMANKRKGVILNIASDLSVISPDQRLYRIESLPEELQPVKPITYSAIKSGLVGITRYIATYWGAVGVRCNALSPGGVFNDHDEQFVKNLKNLIPFNRMANKDEYRGAIQFLCSDASSYLNGQNIVMDGGRSVW